MLLASKRLLRIPASEILVETRGFAVGTESSQARRESIGAAFVGGYHSALEARDLDHLARDLEKVSSELSGFAYEGAAMALALLDSLDPFGGRRFENFLQREGASHAYMMHVGAGWIVGRLPWLRIAPLRFAAKFNPILRWLVIDGFGFHEGYFHWNNVYKQRDRVRPNGYFHRAFDQGLGRSVWFVEACNAERVAGTVNAFHPSRQADLWSGVGLASAYAGGASSEDVRELVQYSGLNATSLSQGMAFAAKARQRAGIMVPHTETACAIGCGMSAADAALVTDDALSQIDPTCQELAYERWRSQIQQVFARSVEETK